MNTSTPATESADVSEVGDIDTRTAALFDELRSDPTSQSTDEGDEDGEGRSEAAPPAAASSVDSAAEAARVARRRRLDEIRQQERQSVDHKERQAHAEKEAARARVAEEKLAAMSQATFSREVLKDPIAVMRMMEEAGVNADQVAEAIRDSIANPNVMAGRAAREAVSPEIATLREQLAAQKAQIDQLLERDQKATADYQERQATEQFVGHVTAQAARAPLSAALLKHDREEFLLMANMAADKVPPGSGLDAFLDAVEDMLDTDVRGVATKYMAIYGQPAVPTSRATQPRPGAVQPNTVSNSLAQERGSLVDEEDFARLSLNERARILSR